MKNIFRKKHVSLMSVAIIGIIVGLVIQFASAWTPPPAGLSPTDASVQAPLSTSSTAQSKSGSLWIGEGKNLLDKNGIVSLGRITSAGDMASIGSLTSKNGLTVNKGSGVGVHEIAKFCDASGANCAKIVARIYGPDSAVQISQSAKGVWSSYSDNCGVNADGSVFATGTGGGACGRAQVGSYYTGDAYMCGPDENKTCQDVVITGYDGGKCDRDWGYARTVTCSPRNSIDFEGAKW